MADTYTSDLGAAESRIQSLTKAVSQGYSGLPGIESALRSSLYEREKVLPALEVENENKIKELYTADKRYAERYATPGGEMYIEDPMARRGLIAGQKADIRGELGGILNLIQQRSQTLGNAIDKGMELYKYGLEAQKLELDQAEKTWSRIMEKMQFEESKKKGSGGTSDAAYLAMLNAIAGGGQPTEEQPRYSPSSGKGTVSTGGQWTYTGKEGVYWEPTNAGVDPKLTAIMKAAQTNPEVAKVFFQNYGDVMGKGADTATLENSERMDLIGSLPSATDPGYEDTDPNSIYLQARQQAKYLTDTELKSILQAKGWFVY